MGHVVQARPSSPCGAIIVTAILALLAPSISAAGPMPTYAELPVGRVTSPPSTPRPESIPAGETVPGLKTTRGAGSSSLYTTVTIDDTSTATLRPSSRTSPNTGACFSTAQDPFEPVTVQLAASQRADWTGTPALQGTIWGRPRGPGVSALHIERVIERDGATSLESTDVWVDPSSQGLRLLSKATLPLREVGTAPGGVTIFAGRDERPDGKRYLQIIVTRGKETPIALLWANETRSDGSTLSRGACSHHRLALLANKNGDSASLQLSVVLPTLPGEAASFVSSPSPPPVPTPSPPPASTPLPPPMPMPSPIRVAAPSPTPTPANTPLPPSVGAQERVVRARPMSIHMSVSQTSRDREPVIAVSTAWAGPEVQSRVF